MTETRVIDLDETFDGSAMPLGLPVEAERLGHTIPTTPYFHWMRRLHDAGIMDTVLGELGATILAVMKGLQGVERAVDETWVRAYAAPFATPEETLGAVAFPRAAVTGAAAFEDASQAAVAALRGKPAMIVCGMRDKVQLPEVLIAIFQAQFPAAPVHRLAQAGHFLQEDAPEAIALLIRQFAHQPLA